MSNFLTLEDANTTIYDNQNFWWYEIDTAKISTTSNYSNVKYDFCTVTRQTNGSNYQYTVTVYNPSWTGGYYVNNGSVSVSSNVLTITSSNSSIELSLYMGVSALDNPVSIGYELQDSLLSLNLEQLGNPQSLTIKSKSNGSTTTVSKTLTKGYNLIEYNSNTVGYVFVKLLKTDFQFNCTQSLVVGRVNKVMLGASADYKPNGDFVGTYVPTITVDYNGETLPVSFDETLNDYVFNLDLSDVNAPKHIRFKVNVETNDVLNESSTIVSLNADYETISSYSSLVNACNVGGANTIKLGSNITLTNSIPIKHSIIIKGNDKTLNLNGKGFVLSEGITLKAEKVTFDSGNIAIKQGKNTTIELTQCNFNNNTGFGSCISCDIDYDSLSIEDDYTTILTDCLFTDNNTCIVHGGQLTVTGCRYHNTDTTYIDSENVAFLYQMDGKATITNCIFDIDYDTDTLCTNEQNIGYAQALLQCGLTANINGATSTDLLKDNSLPFDRNASHIYAKYYYPQVEACVYTSPVLSKEDKAVCYCVTGENWIYKQNVQVTRASWDSQNEIRKITWEE